MAINKGDIAAIIAESGEKTLACIDGAAQKVPGLGIVDTSRIIGGEWGMRLDIGGKQYTIIQPSLEDALASMSRGRQIITPKDGSQILHQAGVGPGKFVIEIGAGSGYGAALAREMAGEKGLVVSVEINPVTYRFAESNLKRTGYDDVVLVLGDGSLGYEEKAPYDAICVTAACPRIPEPLVEQLKAPGRLMAPVGSSYSLFGQDLILLEKDQEGMVTPRNLMKVSYVPLTGQHGWNRRG